MVKKPLTFLPEKNILHLSFRKLIGRTISVNFNKATRGSAGHWR